MTRSSREVAKSNTQQKSITASAFESKTQFEAKHKSRQGDLKGNGSTFAEYKKVKAFSLKTSDNISAIQLLGKDNIKQGIIIILASICPSYSAAELTKSLDKLISLYKAKSMIKPDEISIYTLTLLNYIQFPERIFENLKPLMLAFMPMIFSLIIQSDTSKSIKAPNIARSLLLKHFKNYLNQSFSKQAFSKPSLNHFEFFRMIMLAGVPPSCDDNVIEQAIRNAIHVMKNDIQIASYLNQQIKLLSPLEDPNPLIAAFLVTLTLTQTEQIFIAFDSIEAESGSIPQQPTKILYESFLQQLDLNASFFHYKINFQSPDDCIPFNTGIEKPVIQSILFKKWQLYKSSHVAPARYGLLNSGIILKETAVNGSRPEQGKGVAFKTMGYTT